MRFLMAASWHPGGLPLTAKIAREARLRSSDRLLDVACGQGASALHLALEFQCSVIGVDISPANVREAARGAISTPVPAFHAADAEALPYRDESFDTVVCECAMCSFPNRRGAIEEVVRILRPGGRIILSDVTAEWDKVPLEFSSLLGQALCVAEARRLSHYRGLLTAAGLNVFREQDCRDEAYAFLRGINSRLFLAKLGQAVGHVSSNLDLTEMRRIVRIALNLSRSGQLGYGYLIAEKPGERER